MTIAHLSKLKELLVNYHWKIDKENNVCTETEELEWHISRPNGDTPLTIKFSPGYGGKYCDIQLDEIEQSIACEVERHPDIEYLYFGSKFHGKFQADVVNFVEQINSIDR